MKRGDPDQLVYGQGGHALGVWGSNDTDRVPRDLAAVPQLELPGRFYLDLQPHAIANGRKPEACPPEFVRVRLEDVGAPIEHPFEPLRCPHNTSSFFVVFATGQHNPRHRCCVRMSVSQNEPFASAGYVRHFVRLGA